MLSDRLSAATSLRARRSGPSWTSWPWRRRTVWHRSGRPAMRPVVAPARCRGRRRGRAGCRSRTVTSDACSRCPYRGQPQGLAGVLRLQASWRISRQLSPAGTSVGQGFASCACGETWLLGPGAPDLRRLVGASPGEFVTRTERECGLHHDHAAGPALVGARSPGAVTAKERLSGVTWRGPTSSPGNRGGRLVKRRGHSHRQRLVGGKHAAPAVLRLDADQPGVIAP